MKRLAIGSLVLGMIVMGIGFRVGAQTADAEFLEIYSRIQDAESLERAGDLSMAMDRYQEVRRTLEQFARANPSWNRKIVSFRLGYLAGKVGGLKERVPASSPTLAIPALPAPSGSLGSGPATPPPVAAPGTRSTASPGWSQGWVGHGMGSRGDTTSMSAELAQARARADDAEARATAAEAKLVMALRRAEDETARANEVTDRAALLALDLRQARDRVEVLESAQRNLEQARARLEGDRTTLEAKLKEALRPKAASMDPAELARAHDRNLLLMKENEILKASLERQMAQHEQVLQTAKRAVELEQQLGSARGELASLRRQNQDLRGNLEKLEVRAAKQARKGEEVAAHLREEMDSLRRELNHARATSRQGSSDPERELAFLRQELSDQRDAATALRRENAELVREIDALTTVRVTPASLKVQEMAGIETTSAELTRLRRAERERDELRRALEQARTEIQRRDTVRIEARAEALDQEVRRLEARLEVLESERQPYTAEELAFFKAPERREQIQPLQMAQASPGETGATPGSENSGSGLAGSASAPANPPNPAPAPAPTSASESTPTPPQVPASGSSGSEAPTGSKTETTSPASTPAPPKPPGSASGVGSGSGSGGAGTNAPAAAGTGGSRRRTAKDLPPGAGVLAAQAQRAFMLRRLDEAEKNYREILQLDENNVFTLGNLAAILVEQNRLAEAETVVKRALVLDPEDPFTLSLMGILRFREQRYDEAFDALSRSAVLDPDNADTQNYLGITLSQRGQRTAAEAALRKALKLNPGSPAAHYNLAVVYATQKPPFLGLARYHYEKARRAGQPPNPAFEEVLSGSTPAGSEPGTTQEGAGSAPKP